MTQYKLVHNVETGLIEQVELTDEELQKQQIEEVLLAERIQKESEAKQKRLQLLEKLGITEDEAKLLLS